MNTLWLTIELLSDTTFGRGDGLAGVVDTEVQHDDYGLPYLSGKTLKGLLCAECSEILYALKLAQCPKVDDLNVSASWLFGQSGNTLEHAAKMHVGDAQLPEDLRKIIMEEISFNQITRHDVLDTLTVIRKQSAVDEITGAPQKETFRATRVIVRKTLFECRLDFIEEPRDKELALLSACIKSFRRAGTERHRGRGRVRANLYDKSCPIRSGQKAEAITNKYFNLFKKVVTS